MKKIYYAAAGDNGGVVANSYNQALLYKQYLRDTVTSKNSMVLTRLRSML